MHAGSPPKEQRQDEDKQGSLPREGKRETKQGDDASDVVQPAVVVQSGHDTCGHANERRYDDSNSGQFQGHGQAGKDKLENRHAGAPRGAQVTDHDAPDPVEILDVYWLVKAEVCSQAFNGFIGGECLRSQHYVYDAARDEPHQQEHNDRHPHKGDDHC